MDLKKAISPSAFNAYLKQLQKTGVSPRTIKRKRAALEKFRQWAKEELGILPQEKKFFSRFPKPSPLLSFGRYLGILLLVAGVTALGFFGYQQFVERAKKQLAYPTALTPPNRILSFQGRLTDSGGTPITSATNFVFKLYNTETGGTPLWTSDACSITPDQDGIFSARLGDTSGGTGACGPAIPASVFSENVGVWLEVTVGSETLSPRQPIATAAYALNAETLQGYPASASATANTVPVINNNGDLVIATSSPTIESTSGTFAIKGQALSLQTPDTTDGNITINPDGTGVLNLTFEGASPGGTAGGFVNATNANLTSGALYYGEVASDATGFDFIQFKSGATPTEKFSVDASGNTNISGDLTAGGTITFSGLTTDGPVYTSSGVLNSEQYLNPARGGTGVDASAAANGELLIGNGSGFTLATLTAGTGINITNGSGSITITNTDLGSSQNIFKNIAVSGQDTIVADSNDDTLTFAAGSNITITTDATTDTITISSSASGGTPGGSDGQIQYNNGGSFGGASNFYYDDTNNLIGIGTSSPTSLLHVEGAVTGKALAIFNETGDQNILVASSSGTPKFVITHSGDVGIGTTSPAENLEVSGAIKIGTTSNTNAGTIRWTGTDFEGYTGSSWVSLTSGGGGGLWTDQGTYIYPNNYNQFVITDDGKVGIGTTSPDELLHIYSSRFIPNMYGPRSLPVRPSTLLNLATISPL